MNTVVWMLAGTAIGWAAFALLHFNQERGMLVSLVIGAVGAIVGGKLLAPMLGVELGVPEVFSAAALSYAFASAAVSLFIGEQVHSRFGV